jgi:glycerol-3-phosphate acyltransferase PlsY
MFLNYTLIAVLAYLLGAIPFALIIVKNLQGKDLRNEGSGNIGTMNSYDTTKNKSIALTVLLLDTLKGVIAVLFAKIIGGDFISLGLAVFFSVLGHNFNAFIKFKGGRGLATAAGAFLLINPLFIVFWCLMYAAGWFIIKKNVHIANVTATVCAPLMTFYTPQPLLDLFSTAGKIPVMYLLVGGIAVCILILIKHVKPLVEILKNSNEFKLIRK